MVSKVSAWFIYFFIYLGCNRIQERILRLEKINWLLTRWKYETVWKTSPWEKLWRWCFLRTWRQRGLTTLYSSPLFIHRVHCPLLSLVFTTRFILSSFPPPLSSRLLHSTSRWLVCRRCPMTVASGRVEEKEPHWCWGQRSVGAGHRRLQSLTFVSGLGHSQAPGAEPR